MSCARYRALISRYLDGELTPRQKADLLHHIETCASCSAALAKYRQSEVLLKRLPESSTPAELKMSVMREARRNRRPRGPVRRLVWSLGGGGHLSARLAGIGVLVVLLAITGYVVLPRTEGANGLTFLGTATATPVFIIAPTDSPTPVEQAEDPPQLIASEPTANATGVDTAASLLLRFDQAMDRRSVERAFRVDPPTDGTFSWAADNEVRFTPDKNGLLRGVNYSVSLDSGALSLTGTGVPPGTVLRFSTLAAPELVAAWPPAAAPAVPITATIVLTFSQAMETGSLGVTVRGAGGGGKMAAPTWSLGGDLNWSDDGTVATFKPALPLPSGPALIEIAAGGRDLRGGRLPSYSWPFTVARPERQVAFGGSRLQVLAATAGAEPQITLLAPVETGDRVSPTIDLSAYRLPRAEFESLLPLLLDPAASTAGAPWPTVATATLEQATTWRPNFVVGPQVDSSGVVQTDFPLREPGLYLISAAIAGGRGDQKLALLADTGLMVLADGGHWTVWASRYEPGTTIVGTRIVLYDLAGKILNEALVSSDGFFRVDLPANTAPAAALAIRDGVVVGMAQIDRSRLSPTVEQAPDALVLTDQSAYRPGDLLSFKAFLPGAGGDAGEIVDVSLLDPQRRTIGQQRLKADRLGAFSGSFALDDDVPAGRYSLELAASSDSFVQPITVLAFATPQLLLTTGFDSPSVTAGAPFTATVTASFAPSSPAAAVPITATLRGADGAALGVYTATTTTGGRALFALTAPDSLSGERLYFEAQAGGLLGGQTFASLPVASGDLVLTQELNGHAFNAGDTLVVTATLRGPDGIPLPGRALDLIIASNGGSQPDTELQRALLTTDAAGMVVQGFPLLYQGSFVASVVPADETARVLASDSFWVAGGPLAGVPKGLGSKIQLTPDQPTYHPGDTARLLAQSGEAGNALLLTSYDDDVVSQQTINIAAEGAVINVVIPAAPPLATALHLTILRFDADAAISRSDFDLPLAAPDSGATVHVVLDKLADSYAPGGIVQARISLTDPNGEPLDGQLAVGLLDGDRPDTDSPGSTASGLMNSEAGPGLVGGDTDAIPGAAEYWNDALAVSAGGVVTATVPLPGDPHDWRLRVWSFSKAGVSAQTINLSTVAPVAVEWSPVSYMVQGDTASIGANITNLRDKEVQMEARLLAEGGLSLDASTPGQRLLTLQPGETRHINWVVGAQTGISGRLLLDVGWPNGDSWIASTVRRTGAVTVQPYGVQSSQVRSGALRGDETVGMVLPPSVAPSQADLLVMADPTLAGLLVRAYNAQVVAGRGTSSVSAAAGRLLSNAALSDLANRGLIDPDALPATLNAERALDLQFIYGAQDMGGGWAESPGGGADAETTASVLRALWQLQNAPATTGLAPRDVDAATIQRGLIWLRLALRPAPILPGAPNASDTLPLATRAHAIYVLALFDAASIEDARALLGRANDLDLAAQGWLALALSRLDLGPEAGLLLDRMSLDKLSDSSAALAAAVALQALLSADPAGERANSGDAADFLLSHRSGAGWDAAAGGEALLALGNYSATHPDGNAAFSYSVFVNGNLLREVEVGKGGAGGALQLTVPGSALHLGENSVRLESSDGRIYYSLLARSLLYSAIRPISSDTTPGFTASLLRSYQPRLAGPAPKVGELVTVVTTITVGSEIEATQFADNLPGALLPLGDYTLTAQAAQDGTALAANGQSLDLTAIRTTAGATQLLLPALTPGTYRLTYRALVAHSGTYTALPATLSPAGGSAALARSATAELKFGE